MKMGQYVEVMTYQGKEIVYVNLAGLDEANQLKALNELDQVFSQKNNILAVSNIENTTTTPAVKDKAESNYKKHQHKIKAEALIGVSGIKKIIAQGVKKDIYFAKSLDDAKNWLVRQ